MQNKNFLHQDQIAMIRGLAKALDAEQLLTTEVLTKLEAAIEVFMANPSHEEHYQKLPTKKLKCFELLTWGNSYDRATGEFIQLKKRLEPQLTCQEWDYLIDSTPSVMAKLGYSQLKKTYLGA